MTSDKHMMRDKQWEALQLRFVESWTPCEPDTATEKRADKELTTTTVNCLGKKLGERAHIRLKGLLLCWCFLEIIWAVSKRTKREKNVCNTEQVAPRATPTTLIQQWPALGVHQPNTISGLLKDHEKYYIRFTARTEGLPGTEWVTSWGDSFHGKGAVFYDFGASLGYYVPGHFFEKNSGKANPERTSCVSAFSRLSLF